MHRLLKMGRNQGGFTFLEAIFQLFALLLLSKLFLLMMLSLSPLYQKHAVQEMRWEMLIADLQTFIVQADEVLVRNRGTEILITNGYNRRIVSKSNETIRMQLNSGNEILFIGAETLNFKRSHQYLTLYAELIDGTKEERTFIVPPEK